MEKTLECLEWFCLKNDYKLVGIYPNTDPGSYDIIEIIKKYDRKHFCSFFKNLGHVEFVNLMHNASALVGNSSMGILEAPFYKLPVVNIGERQNGRLRGENDITVVR